MIETTIPELDVAELMQRVRVEAAKIAERTSGRPRASNDAPNLMPPVQVLPPPPASMPIRPVNLKRDRLDHLLRQARQNTEVASWIPKPLRGLFRKQGGFNRHVLETITSLVKTNSELVNRVRDLSTSLEGQAQWLNVLADRRAADGAWMRAAEQKLAAAEAAGQTLQSAREHLTDLQGQLDRLGIHVVNVQKEVDAAGTRDHLAALQGQLDRVGVHVLNLQNEVDAAGTRDHLAALQGQLDRLGVHVLNLQNEVDAAGTRDHLAALQGQLDRLGVHVLNLQNEVDAAGTRDHLAALQGQFDRLGAHVVNLQNEVDAAGTRDHLADLQGQLDRLGVHVLNLQNEVDAAGTRDHLADLQGQLDRVGVHVLNLQNEVDAAGTRDHLTALQGQLDRVGVHVVNVQNEVNAIRDRSGAWADPLRAVERQAEQLGLQINHLQFEIGKNQTETRFAQRTLDQMASKRSSLEQQLMRMEERNAEDAKFIKAIVAEHAALLRQFASDDSAVLQQ